MYLGGFMLRFYTELSRIGRKPIQLYKLGGTITIAALCGIYLLCERDVAAGGVGVELFYAPMLDYIYTTFIIFWGGMLLFDLLERDTEKRSRT